MVTHLTNLMFSWSALPLARMGRISYQNGNLAKNTVPLSILIPVPSHFLRILQRRVLNYVWAVKYSMKA